ncbi:MULTISPECIES: DUF427 domain-containing protein [unclassified Streptomyces]|uniref:DUF427 domain-containing protein n=1 Tax=unclassified Streptomyces TaxID=2593676 RepID=UPI000DB92653|nr:DUF427 domain-containing protein [Streptomyces sp. PsTaAH-137]MYT73441.1 DUF427 domain-containing protein [Streptomyces sp. SID8367]
MSRWVVRPDGGRPSGRTCPHALTADPASTPLSETCLRCAEQGRTRTDLLLCLACGHVGCSDSSPGAHATAHFESSGHPVASSRGPGQKWAWCYEDEVYLDHLQGDEPASLTAPRANESVWDYPRPPAVRADDRTVRIECAGQVVADTGRAIRVLETSHPPVFYIPPADVRTDLLIRSNGRRTWCEWKGAAQYWDVVVGDDVRRRAAWSYPHPEPDYAQLAGFIAFYPSLMDRCTVAGEVVTAQDGDFYGGWITGEVQGPFKGAPGTQRW